MTEHFLKVPVEPYWDLRSGDKTFVSRFNDREFRRGDKLCLEACDSAQKTLVGLPPLYYVVKHVQTSGMAQGYIGLSLGDLDDSAA